MDHQHNPSNPGGAHGPALPLASNSVGAVSLCNCGVLTLHLSCFSVRLEPGAFQELHKLLGLALHELRIPAAARPELGASAAEAEPTISHGEALH
ncbi:hypothetical protein HNP55_001803 [Paucibacter oligotrophus]|uniref:Uncharacterized protein n=1 Tax=Roseateles oligotrophus TaxID=1769250 RepID=A0A840L435_9BURK|nr:hypothetical protein [Roseateles oligotrophus]MBB4843284.1 hypothetical protein [Roseateles oligotrophus]